DGGPPEGPGDYGRGHDPRDGEVPYRAFRGGPGPRVDGRRHDRRVRGPQTDGPVLPCEQEAVPGAVRVRGSEPWRGRAAGVGGGRADPEEGGAGDGEGDRGGAPQGARQRRAGGSEDPVERRAS